uniref:Uncharacterized protein n=1 Tax=viral metagenome TaxID=1070528 RepID=A0A6C0J4G5_9ZZZZ
MILIDHVFIIHGITKAYRHCYLHNRVISTDIGLIGGVSGIKSINNTVNHEAHIYDKKDYDIMLNAVLLKKPNILLTHTPLDNKLDVKMHLFCHSHMTEYINIINNSLILNMDRRIFIWE